jgi:hypothetical protein
MKGKVYEEHKEFAESVVNVPKRMEMDKIKYVQGIKPGILDGLKISAVETAADGSIAGRVETPTKTAIIKIEPSPEGDGAFKDVTHLDAFLLHASRKQVRLLLDGTRVKRFKGGVDTSHIANWKVGAWEGIISHARIPFNVHEMVKYQPMIDKANGKHAGMLANGRSKRALREATAPRGE